MENKKSGRKVCSPVQGKVPNPKDTNIVNKVKPQIKGSGPVQGKGSNLKELNIANLREFTRLTGGFKGRKRITNVQPVRKPWVPKVNRSATKILYEDHDYENVENASDHSSDVELDEIKQKLRLALLMIETQRESMSLGRKNNKSMSLEVNGNGSRCEKESRCKSSSLGSQVGCFFINHVKDMRYLCHKNDTKQNFHLVHQLRSHLETNTI